MAPKNLALASAIALFVLPSLAAALCENIDLDSHDSWDYGFHARTGVWPSPTPWFVYGSYCIDSYDHEAYLEGYSVGQKSIEQVAENWTKNANKAVPYLIGLIGIVIVIGVGLFFKKYRF